MPKTITKKLTFLEYLGPTKQISQLQNLEDINSIIKVSENGDTYSTWSRLNDPIFNSINQLTTNDFYLIISKNSNPNFVLYQEEDAISQDNPIEKKIQFFSPKNDVKIKIMKNRIVSAYDISESGDNFSSWNKNNLDIFNSFDTFHQGKVYLIISENDSIPYYIYPTFDKTSWETISEPYKSYLDQAADRWEQYIRYKQETVSLIKNNYVSWKGLKLDLNQYEEFSDPNSQMIAYAGPYEYVDLPEIEINSVSFVLGINTSFSEFDQNDWINILTHELGHALGIGVFWSQEAINSGSVPPVNNFLDGQTYVDTNSAYNEIIGLTRPKVPLEDSGGDGTNSAHWEDDYRLSSYTGSDGFDYPGVMNELMVGWYSAGSDRVISKLSTKCLVDFGYEEINLGANEGDPTKSTNFRMLNENTIKLNCKNDFKLKKIN